MNDDSNTAIATPPPAAPPFERTRLTWLMYLLTGYFAYLETVLGPVMPFLRAERHFSYTVASLHFSAFAIGGVLVGSVGERVTKRLGRRAALWGGGLGMACGALLMAGSPWAPGTLLGTFLMGTLGALLLATTQAELADQHGPTAAVGLSEANVTASACAIGASLAVGGVAAGGLSWRAALVPPLLALALLAGRYRGARLQAEHTQSVAVEVASGSMPRRFWVYWTVLALGAGIEWCVTYWGADFLDHSAGLSRAGAATALSAFFAAMLAGRIAGSRLARRIGAATLLPLALGLALAGFPLLWLGRAPLLALLGLLVVGLGVANVYPLTVAVAVEAAGQRRDRATARLLVAGGGSVLLAPLALGALADRAGIARAFGVVAPLLCGAVALAWLAGRGSGR